MSEHEDPATEDRDVETNSHRDGSDLQALRTATLKSEEDIEEDVRNHATGAAQAARNRKDDPAA